MTALSITGMWILPEDRSGMFRAVRDQGEEMMTEIRVHKDCPYVNMHVRHVMRRLRLPAEALIKIKR